MKTFILGVMAGAIGSSLLMDNTKSIVKKSKKALRDKIDDILD